MQTAAELERLDASLSPHPERSTAREYTLQVFERWQDLEQHAAAWDDLSAHAVEPNPFYSAAAVLAAMRHLEPEGQPLFLVVRAVERDDPTGAPAWCAFYPFVRFAGYRGLWLRNLRLLKHDYCFLRVPLIRADCVGAVLPLVLAWLQRSGHALAELGDQTGDGRYAAALAATLRGREGAWLMSSHQRALLLPMTAPDLYLRSAISNGRLKELRRQERRLRERGQLEVDSLSADGDVDRAIDEFLHLERAGWKGARGTAMACRPGDREFFRELVREAWRSDRLQLISLRLDGRPIAMKCNFVAPPGAFAFKIAYAEELAQYSPGVLLELENIRRVHRDPRVQWMDSCAAPEHPMIDHLWKDHRRIQTWVVPLNRRGRVATRALAWLHKLWRTLIAASARPRGGERAPRRLQAAR